MKLPKMDVVKIVSLAATAIGFGATLLANWADDKKLDEKVTERVSEILADKK